MRIGFDAKRLFRNFTGLGNYSRTLVENLSSQFPENEYVLFAEKTNNHKRTNAFLNPELYKVVQPAKKSPLWRMYGINQQLKTEQIDVFHGLSAELPVGIKTPSIVTIHDLIFETHPKQYKFVDQKIYSTKAKYACERADKIIAISEATKEDIIRFYNIDESKIDLIYQTCDDSFFREITNEEIEEVATKHNLPNEYLLYVGSVIERKNLLQIIKAIHSQPKENRIPLVAIGGRTSAYGKKVEQYVAKNNLQDDVLLLDNIPFVDFPAIYKKAEVMIYPSMYEGFGIPIIEAQAVGTPVITTNLSCLPEAAGQHSYLLNKVNPESIRAAIEELLNDSSRRAQMAQTGKEYIKKFDKSVNTQQLMELYQSVVSVPFKV